MNLDHLTKEQREDVEKLMHMIHFSMSDLNEQIAEGALDRLVSAIPRHKPTGEELVGKLAMVCDENDGVEELAKIVSYDSRNSFPYATAIMRWKHARAITPKEQAEVPKMIEY